MKRMALVLLALVMACGDDNKSTGPTGGAGAGALNATVDGAAFSGTLAVQAVRSATTLTITAVTANTRSLSINLFNVSAAGTFSLGTGSTNNAQYSQGTQAWVSSLAGGSGSVTLTTLTASRAVGTFSFTGIPSTSTGATGNKSVTNGSFDVSY